MAWLVQGVSTRSCCAQLPCVAEKGCLKDQSLCFKLSLKAEEVQERQPLHPSTSLSPRAGALDVLVSEIPPGSGESQRGGLCLRWQKRLRVATGPDSTRGRIWKGMGGLALQGDG